MPITASKAAFAVLALGATSVLGYNWITTGCPSGVCPAERAAAKLTPVANTHTSPDAAPSEKPDACCPLMAAAETTNADLPACCAELGQAACGDPTQCADMPAPSTAEPAAETSTETASTQPEPTKPITASPRAAPKARLSSSPNP